jgi:DNA invertase Pin-like site-specific DNA recombinase
MQDPTKIKYINRDEIIDEFKSKHPEYANKKLTVPMEDQSYTIKYGRQLLLLVYSVDGYIFKETGRTYGYARISRKEQSIDRQIRNIKADYPNAIIVQEAYTGTKMNRPEWNKLHSKVKTGDAIVFDSVSRMSRNADEGIETYFELFGNGIQLVFLKEHYIDTSVYAENMKDKIELQGVDEDEIFKGLNNYFRKLAARQIRIAFEQADKEVQDLHQRTKEGIETARLKGKQIGQQKGKKLHVKKELPAKEKIRKYSKYFNGTLSDRECIQLVGVSRNTYYKYKAELRG